MSQLRVKQAGSEGGGAPPGGSGGPGAPPGFAPGIGAVAARLLVPAWLLVLAGIQIADGTTDALPVWLHGLAIRFGLEPVLVMRLLLGAEFLLAGLMLLLGRWARTVATLALLAACFSAVASLSATGAGRDSLLVNVVILVVSLCLLVAVHRGGQAAPGTLSPAWRAIAALAILVIAATVAARVEIRPARDAPRRTGATARLVAVDLDFRGYIGRPLSETPLREHIPKLMAATLEGRHVVVFYSPRCGMCHDLFRERFSGELPVPTIAVLVPSEPGAALLPSDQPEQVDCPRCTFMELPRGPIWLLTPPTLVVVEDGIITCVNERGESSCLDGTPATDRPQADRPDAAPESASPESEVPTDGDPAPSAE